jgi:hypothetical protein
MVGLGVPMSTDRGAAPALRRRPTAIVIALAAALSMPITAQAVGGAPVAIATGSGQTAVRGELRTFSFTARLQANGAASGTAQVDNRR